MLDKSYSSRMQTSEILCVLARFMCDFRAEWKFQRWGAWSSVIIDPSLWKDILWRNLLASEGFCKFWSFRILGIFRQLMPICIREAHRPKNDEIVLYLPITIWRFLFFWDIPSFRNFDCDLARGQPGGDQKWSQMLKGRSALFWQLYIFRWSPMRVL